MIWYAIKRETNEVIAEAEGFCNCSDAALKVMPEWAEVPGSVAPYFISTHKDW